MSTEQAQPIACEESTSGVADNATAEDLFEKGCALKDDDAEAIDILSRALELIVIKRGELHPETARFYHQYGRRLVESSKRDSDMFAKIEDQVKSSGEKPEQGKPEEEKQEQPEDAATSNDLKDGQEAAAATSGEESAQQPAVDAAEEASGEKTASTEMDTSGKAEAVEPAPSGKEEATSEEMTASAELIEARELAWQLLETARVVYSKDEPKNISSIAAVHCLLGDVAMEDGNFQRAYPEYVKASQMYGKHAGMADRRLGEAHQLAGLCALYDQQNEASIFHYTAAAEAFNNKLTELLVKEKIMEAPSQDTEDIEFVDEAAIEKLKEKVGKDSPLVKEANELNGIVNNLIERVEEIQEQMEADANNPKLMETIMKLGQQIAEKMKNLQDGEGGSTGFDKPTAAPCEDAKEINVLVPKKRPVADVPDTADNDGAAKRQKMDTSKES